MSRKIDVELLSVIQSSPGAHPIDPSLFGARKIDTLGTRLDRSLTGVVCGPFNCPLHAVVSIPGKCAPTAG